MSMSTRRAKLSNVIMPEEPAKLQPCQKIVDEKEHLPEDDNEEWEEVLVGSYIPLPVIWDEHPTAQKLEKLIEKMEFQVHQEPVPNIRQVLSCFSTDKNRLCIIPDQSQTLPTLELTRTHTGYQRAEKTSPVWAETNLKNSRKEVSVAPSGKFIIILSRMYGLATCTVWR